MKVGYVLNQYPTVSATFIVNEVRALRDAGVDVHTFSMWPTAASDRLSRAAEEEGERTTTVRPLLRPAMLRAHVRALARSPRGYLSALALALKLRPPGAREAVRQFFYFVEAIVVWDECRRRGVRHLHAHFGNVACDVALLASHLGDGAGGPWSFSFTVHGPNEFYELAHNRLPEKARRAALVVCISHFSRSQVMGMLPQVAWDKTTIVHCGIEPDAFSAPPRERSAAERMRVLCVGRLVPVKGQGVLLEAVAELTREGREVEVTYVGEGPDRPALEAAVERLGLQDRVHLVGAIGQDTIRKRTTPRPTCSAWPASPRDCLSCSWKRWPPSYPSSARRSWESRSSSTTKTADSW